MEKKRILFVSQEIMPFLPKTEVSATSRRLPQGVQDSGKEIRVTLDLLSSSGKSRQVEIRGEDIATYSVPASTRAVSMTNISKGVSGAALIASKSGSGYLPLLPGSVLTKSSIPSSDISVLNP